MKVISKVPYKDIEINLLVEKSEVGYFFKVGEEHFGNKTKLQTKKRDELVGVVATLTVNAIASYEAVINAKNTNRDAA